MAKLGVFRHPLTVGRGDGGQFWMQRKGFGPGLAAYKAGCQLQGLRKLCLIDARCRDGFTHRA